MHKPIKRAMKAFYQSVRRMAANHLRDYRRTKDQLDFLLYHRKKAYADGFAFAMWLNDPRYKAGEKKVIIRELKKPIQ